MMTSSKSKASAPTVNLKLGRSRPKAVAFQDIWNIDPKIELKYQPKNDLETWWLGTVYKLVHQGVNKCISNATIVDYYQSSIGVVKDYHSLLKIYGQQEFKSLPQPQSQVECTQYQWCVQKASVIFIRKYTHTLNK